MRDSPRSRIVLFLALTLVLESAVYAFFLGGREKASPRTLFGYAGMWAPGVAALLTRGLLQRSARGMGWGPGAPRFLLYAYLLPLVLELPVYLFAWGTGLAGFAPGAIGRVAERVLGFAAASPLANTLLLASVGFLVSVTSALGEELGWRGLLVPELARIGSFRRVALVSGIVWAVFHYPLLLAERWHPEVPLAYSLPMFTLTLIFASHVFAWLRLKSRSLWPAVVLHAAHNIFIIGVFDAPTFAKGPATWWITGESGCGLALVYGIAAIWVSRDARRSGLARPAPPLKCSSRP